MLMRKAALCAAMSSLVFMSSTASASEGCWYPDEIQAAQLTELETKLMVDTLKCRRQMPWLEEDYNAFEERNGEFLKTQYPIIIGRFMREDDGSPGGWRRAYDHYRTLTANNYSGVPSAPESGECARAASLARVAGRVSGEELRLLAESVAEAGPGNICGPTEPVYGPRAVPSRSSGVADRQPWAPAYAGPTGSPAPVIPSAAAPVGAGAAAPTAPGSVAAPQVSSSEALAAAVVALQAATAALQAAVSAQAK